MELENTFVSAIAVCNALNIHRHTLQRMVKEKRIDHITIGRDKRYNLTKYINDNLKKAS